VNNVAKDVMGAVKLMHNIAPLPTFNINGDPIKPSQYMRFLKGTIIEVHFALMSWVFAGRNTKCKWASRIA
jgi:hypothetical protein